MLDILVMLMISSDPEQLYWEIIEPVDTTEECFVVCNGDNWLDLPDE